MRVVFGHWTYDISCAVDAGLKIPEIKPIHIWTFSALFVCEDYVKE